MKTNFYLRDVNCYIKQRGEMSTAARTSLAASGGKMKVICFDVYTLAREVREGHGPILIHTLREGTSRQVTLSRDSAAELAKTFPIERELGITAICLDQQLVARDVTERVNSVFIIDTSTKGSEAQYVTLTREQIAILSEEFEL